MGLKIYIASAGSGKTFSLVRNYLEKVIANTFDYKRILAITFTNKAAEEMKSRIISELVALSKGEKSDHHQFLKDTLKISDDLIKERATIVMQFILHDYSSFAVSTIDSYFQVLSKTLARELKLPIHYTIELDTDTIANTVTERVLELSGKNQQLTIWLEELLLDKIDNNKGWSIRADLKQMVFEIINRPIVSAFSNALSAQQYQQYVRNIKIDYYQRIDILHSKYLQIVNLLNSHGYTSDDFKGKSKGAIAFIERLSKNKLKIGETELSKAFINAVSDYNELLPGKTNPNEPIHQFVTNILHNEICELNQLYQANFIDLLTIREILKLSYQAGVIEKLNDSLKLYRDEFQSFLLSDTTKLLQDVAQDDDASFIYEKSGNAYHYLFIDEFQDTSDAQWQILRPMVKNSLSIGKDALIVGDAKQSIYRWRGGNMELILKGVKEDLVRFQTEISEIPLSTNYRSKNNIIDFNNAIFKSTATQIRGLLSAPNVTLEKAYDDDNMVQENQGEKTQGGYVEINFINNSKSKKTITSNESNLEGSNNTNPTSNEEIPESNLNRMVEIIDNALSRNYSLKDIAIIVRENKDDAKVANYLLDNTSHNFSSENSLKITSNNKVRFIISCIKYLHDYNNKVLIEELNYFAETLLVNDGTFQRNSNFINDGLNTWVEAKLKPEINNLKTLPVNICYWQLINLTGLNHVDLFLEKFHDVMLEYIGKEGGSIEFFIKWWDEKSVTKKWTIKLPEANDAISIITIHQAKGLEFPIVIMPFADWKIKPMSNQTIWGETNQSPYNSTVASPLLYTEKLTKTYFSNSFSKEQDNNYVDNINLLYVAFTRPKAELYVFTNLKSNKDCLGSLLLKSIESSPTLGLLLLDQGESKQLIIGTQDNNTYNETKATNFESLAPPENLYLTASTNKPVLPSLSYKIKSDDQLYGDYLHHLLSKMNKSTDLDSALHTLKINANIYNPQVLDRLKNDALNAMDLLESHNLNSELYSIKNESSIYFEGEIFRPDRVLMKDDTAIIIDFKTGGQEETHKKQVEKYCAVVQKMGFSKVSGYLLYTESNSLLPVN